MTNLDQMAHEYALQILKNITPDRGYISGLTIERIAETAYGLAEAMCAESKECGGVPDAILEASKGKALSATKAHKHTWIQLPESIGATAFHFVCQHCGKAKTEPFPCSNQKSIDSYVPMACRSTGDAND